MAKTRSRSTQRRAPDYTVQGDIGGGPGASDSYSGGGNASGIPDAETGMRSPRSARSRHGMKEDRAKLFPERFGNEKRRASAARGVKGSRAEMFPERSAGKKRRAAAVGGAEERGPKTVTAKGVTGKPLKTQGDKFEDKIPGKTRTRATAGARTKKAR